MQSTTPLSADLVLLGGGHAHVHILKMYGMPNYRAQLTGIRVTLIAKDLLSPYSGMLPGHLAGHYQKDEMHLDLGKLARFCGARVIHASAVGVEYDNGGGGRVLLDTEHPPVRFDCLSIDIGAAPLQGDLVASSATVTPVKPIASFTAMYDRLLEEWSQRPETADPYTLAVVGGGAGGVEVALAVEHRLRAIRPSAPIQLRLVTRSTTLLSSHNARVQRIMKRVLAERGIEVMYQAEVIKVEPEGHVKRLVLSQEAAKIHPESILVDACLWCVTAGVDSWLATATPLRTHDGFVVVGRDYQCVAHPGVFAAGDCCHFVEDPRPKAGVFAVRAGPILVENLLGYLMGRRLTMHYPQPSFLGLISTGDQYAIASKGSWLAVEGRWLWTLKDWVDRRWMRGYQELPDMTSMAQTIGSKSALVGIKSRRDDVREAFESDPIRCGGCGAKVGASTVSRVLKAIYQRQVARAAKHGLEPPPPIDHDDSAIVRLPKTTTGKTAIVTTIDYFRELLPDPFLFGKVVAVHALSDVHAMGAKAQTAMVLAVVPFAADESMTESTLVHLLSGVSDVLQDEGVQLVGGHTCEGLEMACGLSVQGYTDDSAGLLRKRGGRVGDRIILTKPLGTGALFAADMRAKARAEHVAEAIESMIRSNLHASREAMDSDEVHACTDVTGFGLIGHLLEMLMANEQDKNLDDIGAVLDIRAIPFLKGGLAASADGIYSSLQKQNERSRRAINNHSQAAEAFPVEYPLLFDPQTAGGLLFFVDPIYCDEFLLLLQSDSVLGWVIGELVSYPETEQVSNSESFNGDACVIGQGESATGQRIRIALDRMPSLMQKVSQDAI